MDTQALGEALRACGVELGPEVENVLGIYYGRLLEESKIQNLTTLLEPKDFVEGHVLDCLELLNSGFLTYPAMDLGSGAGVPGLVSAILGEGNWLLAESEKRKADFLRAAVEETGLNARVRVISGRAEDYLKNNRVGTIAVRAVGHLSKIFRILRPRSTWNNLVLLKSRGWAEEWAAFQAEPGGKELVLDRKHEYSVGAERKYRILVRLNRLTK